jgi:uncharacterized protein YqjF (DUF2071 family)
MTTRPDLPTRPAAVLMTWADVAFVHWPVPVEMLRPLIPHELELDLHHGVAWVGLIPFEMRDCRFRGVPPLPGLGRFLECNVRTYVRHRGIPGVWFFSLDAASRIAVIGGRVAWGLNYRLARFEHWKSEKSTRYALSRNRGDGSGHLDWTPGDVMPSPPPDSLEHFLVERYHLYSMRRGRLLRGRVDHSPWELRDARIDSMDTGIVTAAGIPVDGDPIAFCSKGVRVSGFSPVYADQPED